MFISNCFAYSNITVELNRDQENCTIAIKDKNNTGIHLTFNYLQTKVLAEGLTTLAGQTPLSALEEIEYKNILGDIRLEFDAEACREIETSKGRSAICQPTILPVPTDKLPLSESA